MPEKRTKSEIERISQADAREYLRGTYADPDAAAKLFDQVIAERKKALQALEKEVNGDQHVAQAMAKDPVGFLHERKLLGPLDQISIEGLRNPFIDWPWPFPHCWVVWTLEIVAEVEWICVGFWPFRFCFPILVLRLRWVSHIVCG
jgi:hypothetical protein